MPLLAGDSERKRCLNVYTSSYRLRLNCFIEKLAYSDLKQLRHHNFKWCLTKILKLFLKYPENIFLLQSWDLVNGYVGLARNSATSKLIDRLSNHRFRSTALFCSTEFRKKLFLGRSRFFARNTGAFECHSCTKVCFSPVSIARVREYFSPNQNLSLRRHS